MQFLAFLGLLCSVVALVFFFIPKLRSQIKYKKITIKSQVSQNSLKIIKKSQKNPFCAQSVFNIIDKKNTHAQKRAQRLC